MTDNDLLKQLKSLKKLNPNDAWLKSNREILLSQVINSGAKELSPYHRLVIDVRSFFSSVSKPALAFGSFLVVLVSAAAFGHLAFSQMKPNESLYIARIISEKAKLTTVFNNADREKMEVQFATGHAEAITETLAETDVSNEVEVAKLNDSFNKEINTVRTKMATIKKNNNPAPSEMTPATSTEDDLLLTADNGKADKGVQLSLNNGSITNPVTATNTAAVATDTPAVTADAVITEPVIKKAPEQILDEAQALFDNKEYSGALDKLKEVKELIK